MEIIKGLSSLLIIILLAAAAVPSGAETFEDRGLKPVAIVINDHSLETFSKVKLIVEDSEVKGLGLFPPNLIFGYFPMTFDEVDISGFDVNIVRSANQLSGTSLSLIEIGVASNLFNHEQFRKEYIPQRIDPGDDIVLEIPSEIIEATKTSGPRLGSPSEITERNIQQNSEFLIGSVLINIIFPESNAGSEDWTDDEIAAALSVIAIGCQDYQQYALFTNLTFTYNYQDYKRVPISVEPIEVHHGYDYGVWIPEVFTYLGYSDGEPFSMTHNFNNDTRNEFRTDWVFTAFVVDASENGCWLEREYVAYTASYGGPYLVIPFPACRFGDGVGFAHVFIHEMSHVFWALDEYLSEGGDHFCSANGGYLNYLNKNSRLGGGGCLDPYVDCIMNNATLQRPLPVCYYTRGQVGLGADDYYWGTVPEIYNVKPGAEFRETTELSLDTVYSMPYEMGLHVWNDAVPNENPFQSPETRIDYAAKIKTGHFWINGSIEEEIEEPLTGWTSNNWLRHTIPSLEPGRSEISYRFENIAGLAEQITKSVYYIGIKYYFTELSPSEDRFDITWSTSGETFGAVFDIVKQNLSLGTPEEIIATVEEPTDFISDRRIYTFSDEDIEPAHQYRYCIVGRFDITIAGVPSEIRVPTDDMYEVCWIPTGNDLVSNLLPNPTSSGTSITIDVPRSYYDPSGTQDNATRPANLYSAASVEVLTPVDIGVYNIKGQRVATVYNNKLFGATRTFQWNGTDSYGKPVAPGVYFMRVVAGDRVATKKVVIIR